MYKNVGSNHLTVATWPTYHVHAVADWAQTTQEVRALSVHVTVDRQELVSLSLSIHLTCCCLATSAKNLTSTQNQTSTGHTWPSIMLTYNPQKPAAGIPQNVDRNMHNFDLELQAWEGLRIIHMNKIFRIIIGWSLSCIPIKSTCLSIESYRRLQRGPADLQYEGIWLHRPPTHVCC